MRECMCSLVRIALSGFANEQDDLHLSVLWMSEFLSGNSIYFAINYC